MGAARADLTWRDRFYLWRRGLAERLAPHRLAAGLRLWRRLYVSEQIAFLRSPDRPRLRFAPRRVATLLDRQPVVPPTGPNPPLLTFGPVEVVSERQFAFDDRAYYVYLPGTVFASLPRHFPNLTLYEVAAPECFGSLAYAHGNYYHDVVELGFQAWWLARQGIDLRVLFMGLPRAWQIPWKACLESLGVKFLVLPSRLARLTVERFHVLPESHGRIARRDWNYQGELFDQFSRYVDDLKTRLLPPGPAQAPFRLIYSTRRGRLARIPPNNQAVEELMASLGLEVVDQAALPWAEQVALMNQAALVVGLHGANLTNVMFMQPGARVVELMPAKKEDDDAYKRLSFIRGLDYLRLSLPKGQGVDMEFLRRELSSLLPGKR